MPRRSKRQCQAILSSTPLSLFQSSHHSLTISASQISSLSGYNPYTNLPELLLYYVYQGPIGQLLLKQDAKKINLTLISQKQEIELVLEKAGKETKEQYNKALKDHNVANDANSQQQKLVETAKKSKKLSVEEVKLLDIRSSHKVNTKFGCNHEDNALDLYEKEVGCVIRERNEQMMCWKFLKNNTLPNIIPLGKPFPKRDGKCTEVITIETGEVDVIKPYFTVQGKIDGIRDELYPVAPTKQHCNFVNGWELRPIVVECKHRMGGRALIPPPLYDQIQVVIYCLLFGTQEADLVQVVRKERSIKEKKKDDNSPIKLDIFYKNRKEIIKSVETPSKKNNNNNYPNYSIKITPSRISLDPNMSHHLYNFYHIILPRVGSFVQAVYKFRSNNKKRYQILIASCEADSSGGEKDDSFWHVLFEECPWLKDCDTLYKRQKLKKKKRELDN